MPAPPQRYGVWFTGYLDNGVGVDDSSFDIWKMDNSFGPQVPSPTITVNSDDYPSNNFALGYWDTVTDRSVSQNDALEFPSHLNRPGWCFSTVDVGSRTPADAGDFVPDNQGQLTRTYIPSGSQMGFDFYVGTDVTGSTLQAPEVNVYAHFFRLNINTGDAEEVALAANTTTNFSLGGSVEQVSANTTVNQDVVFERNEVLVVCMVCLPNPPNPTLGGTVTLEVDLLYNTTQGGLGGDNTVRGAFDVPLRTFTQDEGFASSSGEGGKTVGLSKFSNSSVVGSSTGAKVSQFFRDAQSVSPSEGEEVKTVIKKEFPITATSDGLEMTKAYKKFGPAFGVSVPEITKFFSKEQSGVSVSESLAQKVAEFTRQADAETSNTSEASRTVTYIRSADGVAVGDILPNDVKICIPITSLSESGEGGGETIVNVRPVFIFDD